MFLVNSRYPLVSATLHSSGREVLHQRGHTFSRSYGVNLPSSLSWVLSSALGYSPRPPESVCGTDTTVRHSYRSFSRKHGITEFMSASTLLITSRGNDSPFVALGLLANPPTGLNRLIQQSAQLPFSVPPVKTNHSGSGILT